MLTAKTDKLNSRKDMKTIKENSKNKWDTVIHHEDDYDNGKTSNYIGKAVRDAKNNINHNYSGGAYSEGPFPSEKVARRYAKKKGIKLKESQLRAMIAESINEILKGINDYIE